MGIVRWQKEDKMKRTVTVKVETEAAMTAVLIDEQDNTQVIELNPDSMIDVKDYFEPCGNCGEAVLKTFWGPYEYCARCSGPEKLIVEAAHMVSDMNPDFEIGYYMAPCGVNYGPYAIFCVSEDSAVDAVHNQLTRLYGRAFDFQKQEPNLVTAWIRPEAERRAITVDDNFNGFDSFEAFAIAHKLDNWNIWNSGGGCMIANRLVRLKDGRLVVLGVNSECVCLYNNETFDDGTLFDWFKGDDHWKLVNYLLEFLDTEIVTAGLLVEEIKLIMHSQFV